MNHLFFGMRLRSFFALLSAIAAILTAQNGLAQNVVSSTPVYVPNTSHQSDHLDQTTLAWDATMKTTNVPANTPAAHFVFYFTNVAVKVDRTLTTNVTDTATKVVWITNSVTPLPVTILDVHPSCHCTTAHLPPLPWTLPPGTNGQISVTVDLAGKYGIVYKTVYVGTDKGSLDLTLQINILPPKIPVLTDAERIRQMAIAKADRQAVFRNDCAMCHEKPGENKYGKPLYDADCAICHEAKNRASMVPDLHSLKVPTNDNFWRTWIAHGKAGTFMPAFSTAEGGPLSDMQIASLAAYLNYAIPSKVPQP